VGQEDAPLLADAGENLKARVEEDATFTAKEQPGGVKVNYTWDFDDTDGIGEDGYGSTTKWTFLAPGHYNVTLTVSDPADQRVPRTDRIHVQVEE